jgi:heme-degrading monooxygenase HmoA
MVITVLEATVDRQNWQTLESVFASEVKILDPGIVQTFLIQSKSEPTLWRIMTFWESQEALTTMRQSGETPRGVVMFRAANADPKLSVFDIIAQSKPIIY